jgi:N,N'-diacetyllegionaminate synthase
MHNKTLIIAEAGVNHNGDLSLARQLIREAAKAGADYVKFQTFRTELNISPLAVKAAYQIENTGDGGSQFEMVKKLELSFEDFSLLAEECKSCGIGFLSTGFDFPSIDFLEGLPMPVFKIPSGEITNKPYLEYVAGKKRPVILSTGMASLDEVKVAISILIDRGLQRSQITVLHCNTEYPTPMKDVNLKAMLQLRDELNVVVGYSDHTLGIEVPIAAVALGAQVIEKHFTLDRNMDGPDHTASLEPDELGAMVKAIRNVELAISGDGEKTPSESEFKNRQIARKSIHLARVLQQGSPIQPEDLIMLRPGDGISPMDIDHVLGRTLNQTLEAGTKLLWTHLSD